MPPDLDSGPVSPLQAHPELTQSQTFERFLGGIHHPQEFGLQLNAMMKSCGEAWAGGLVPIRKSQIARRLPHVPLAEPGCFERPHSTEFLHRLSARPVSEGVIGIGAVQDDSESFRLHLSDYQGEPVP